jgi:glycosyltransferase involved in cell wall biosynthesis
VVHTNDGRIHVNWAVAARIAGAKLVWHHRGDPTARSVNLLAPLTASKILTVSYFSRPSRPILPIASRLTVLRSPFDRPSTPVDRNEARNRIVAELSCPTETRFVSYFGTLIDRKRPLRFVEAVYALVQKHPEIPIQGLIFGRPAAGGPPFDLYVQERAAELGIADKIHLMGFRDPVEPWMAGVDILLVPAMSEPFGRTLIEAMILGTPVVATRHGGNPEAIENGVTGFLVEAEKPEAFVAPIHQLLSNPGAWAQMSQNARLAANAEYGVAEHVERVTEIYETLTRRSKPPMVDAPLISGPPSTS